MKLVSTTNAPAALGPYSQAQVVGSMVYTSGQLGIDPATGALLEGVEAQAHQAFKNLAAVLKAAGSGMSKVVKTTAQRTPCTHSISQSHSPPAPASRSPVCRKTGSLSARS